MPRNKNKWPLNRETAPITCCAFAAKPSNPLRRSTGRQARKTFVPAARLITAYPAWRAEPATAPSRLPSQQHRCAHRSAMQSRSFQLRQRWPEMLAIGPLPMAPAMAVSPRLFRPRYREAQMPPTSLRSPQTPPPSTPSANCPAGSLRCRAAALPPQPSRLRLQSLPAAQPSASGSTSGGA